MCMVKQNGQDGSSMWQPKTDTKNENCLAENGTFGMYEDRDGERCYRSAVMKTPVSYRENTMVLIMLSLRTTRFQWKG